MSALAAIKRTIYIVLYHLQSTFIHIISCNKRMFSTLGDGASTYLVGQSWNLSVSHPTINHQPLWILTCKHLLTWHWNCSKVDVHLLLLCGLQSSLSFGSWTLVFRPVHPPNYSSDQNQSYLSKTFFWCSTFLLKSFEQLPTACLPHRGHLLSTGLSWWGLCLLL